MFSQLPQELITKIFWNLSLKDCRSFLCATKSDKNKVKFNPIIVEYALEDRQSTTLYLGHFFPDSSELLERMRMYNAWIVESFALNYFSDHVEDEVSEIKFIMPRRHAMFVNFMEYLRIKGINWSLHLQSDMYVDGLFHHNGLKIKIRLMAVGHTFNDMINFIRGKDLSILQCAITGYSVFHMYSNDVYDKKSSIWGFEHDTMFTYMPSKELTKKYLDLGYKLAKGSRYLPNDDTLRQIKISRTIGGIGSEIITFRKLKVWSYDSMQHEKEALLRYRWDEYASFLRESFTDHSDIQGNMLSLWMSMRTCFMNPEIPVHKRTIDTFTNAYHRLEKSMTPGSEFSLDKKYEYESLDQNYYAQFKAISLLQKY